MRELFDKYLWSGFFGPQKALRFKFRIWLRVQWLYFNQWWKRFRLWEFFKTNLPRPIGVMLAFVIPLGILSWLGIPLSDVKARLVDLIKGAEGAAPLSWQTALILIGTPIAFILWVFRDINARQNLENQRKDINLKEFQEIQMRAAGALDEKLPAKARETMQIAAIHQLRPFLRGEYGAGFRRPAWELLKARLAISAEESGYSAIRQLTEQGGFPDDDYPLSEDGEVIADEIRERLERIPTFPVTSAERAIIKEEYDHIFRKDLPLRETRLGGMDLSNAILSRTDLQSTSFIGAYLRYAHLEGADLSNAYLEGSYLSDAHLEGAALSFVHLEGAILSNAHLEGAKLSFAHLEGAVLSRACLVGADLSFAYLNGADLSNTHLEGVDLSCAHLEGADLSQAYLKDAVLSRSHLEGADLSFTYLQGADLSNSHLEGIALFYAHLEGANLSFAHLEGAVLSGTYLDETTKLSNAIYDDNTIFDYNWDSRSDEQKEEARKPWRDRGMVHINETER